MNYISYFDLLGTRGFCDNSKIYYQNINRFYEAVYQLSTFLKGGKVGVFSDCAYAETSSLYNMLAFLVGVRDRLIAQGLFFNAVVKEGNLDIDVINDMNTRPTFGVVFKNSEIADLYITQSRFKGIGINVDSALIEEIEEFHKYTITKCIYLEKINEGGTTLIKTVPYFDVGFDCKGYQKELEHTLDIFYHAFYSAYIKSPKFGMYYISALSNFLRSCDYFFEWDFEKKQFVKYPLEFKTVENMLKSKDLSGFEGIEYLALIMLDIVYNDKSLDEEAKKSYTKNIVEIDCVKNRFIHFLNEIPNGIFSYNPEENVNNRELFIRYCQDDLSDDFVDMLFLKNE